MNKINYVSVSEVKPGDEVYVKVRYSDKPGKAKIYSVEDDLIILDLIDEKRAVTPGQSSVLYDGEGYLLVGGIILKDLTNESKVS
jgi:tRNA-specific 2-thiouridylase